MQSWRVEVQTSGGLSGRGVGGVAISADGRIEASTETQKCSAELAAPELQSIVAVVRRSKPSAWRQSYQRGDNPYGGADQFQYTLRLTIEALAVTLAVIALVWLAWVAL